LRGKAVIKQRWSVRLPIRTGINLSPVIVLGNQKSGTSAIAHLIADYAGLSKTVDIPELYWPTTGSLLSGELSLADFVKRYRFRFSAELIKDPNLTFIYDPLKELYQEGRFLFIVRDPRDNIRSILNRMGLPGNLERIQIDNFKLEPDVKRYWLPILEAKIMRFDKDHYIQTLAARWNHMVDVYLRNKTDIILIRYEDFTADKIGIIEEVAERLGLERKRDITDRVDVQYQPSGLKDVSWPDFFGKTNLSYIEELCGMRMGEFRY